MRFGRYTFTFQVEGNGRLPRFKGSALRGTFGHALKKVTCAVRKKSCQDCLLIQRCLYGRLFETQPWPQGSTQQRTVAPPHPYG